MNERIRQLRKDLNLTQTEFGNRLGIKQTTVAGYETGGRAPIDAVVSLICREFNVNEEWLRTGKGGDDNKYVKSTPYQRAYNRFGYIMENSTPAKKATLSMLLELLYTVPDDAWDAIIKEFEEIKKGLSGNSDFSPF
ncbi:helix-turn-helix transcriptional regulator [Lachnospiraceae bacterium 62-26]